MNIAILNAILKIREAIIFQSVSTKAASSKGSDSLLCTNFAFALVDFPKEAALLGNIWIYLEIFGYIWKYLDRLDIFGNIQKLFLENATCSFHCIFNVKRVYG